MKGFGILTATVLVVIGIGVGIVAATVTPAPAPTSPTGIALSYLADFKSGRCSAAEALFVQTPKRWGCMAEPSFTSPGASAASVPRSICQPFGCNHAFAVSVTFKSWVVGWTGYTPRPPIHLPATLRWDFFVGQMPNGEFKLLPVFPQQG